MWVKENGQEWQEERKGREGKTERKGEVRGEGDRQRLGPTYNREHERAQNVPQWGPGDGRNRWHHALKPMQPTRTLTTATHTHTYRKGSHMDLQAHTHPYEEHSVTESPKCNIFTVNMADFDFFNKATLGLSTTVWWFWSPALWLFTASLQGSFLLLIPDTLLGWITITLHLSALSGCQWTSLKVIFFTPETISVSAQLEFYHAQSLDERNLCFKHIL